MNYKVVKIKKNQNGLYEVNLDKKELLLYEEIVLKYDVLIKKDISDYFVKKMIQENKEVDAYQKCLDYLKKQKKTEYEVRSYLNEQEFSLEVIEVVLERLRKLKLVDDYDYAKRYIHYMVSYRLTGPRNIRQCLLKRGIKEDISNSILKKYDAEVWYEKIRKQIVSKRQRDIRKSDALFRQNIINELIYNGYPKVYVTEVLKDMDTDQDKEAIENELAYLYKKYQTKYSGYELSFRIKRRLSEEGFLYSDIKEAMQKFLKE